MKKCIFTISIAFMVPGCHKKEVLVNQVVSYLEKTQNKTLPVEQRIPFNKKALDLILQSDHNDSLFFNYLFKIANT